MERLKTNRTPKHRMKKDKVSVGCQTDDPSSALLPVPSIGSPQRVRSVAGGGVVTSQTVPGQQSAQTPATQQTPAATASTPATGGDPATTSKCEEGVLRLTIPGFSKLSDTKCSDAMRIQTVPWRIMVMPKQHVMQKKSQKCLGFFLQCCPDNAYSDTWSCHAVAEMRLLSQRAGSANFSRKTNHTYTSKENDWGYSCFMTWADILDESQGYIKDDTIQLEISLKAEEPKNMMTKEEFRKNIEKWYSLAAHHLSRGAIDLAIEANAQALKYCKDKDKESKERLETQKNTIIQHKLLESIQRIEKGKDQPNPAEPAAVTPTSLKQVLTSAQRTYPGCKVTEVKKGSVSSTKSKPQARGAVVKSPQHAVLKKKMEMQKQALQQQKVALNEKNKTKPSKDEATEDEEKGQGDNKVFEQNGNERDSPPSSNGVIGDEDYDEDVDDEEDDEETQSCEGESESQYADDDDLTDVAPLSLGDEPQVESSDDEDDESAERAEDEDGDYVSDNEEEQKDVEMANAECQTEGAYESTGESALQQQQTVASNHQNRVIAVPKRSKNQQMGDKFIGDKVEQLQYVYQYYQNQLPPRDPSAEPSTPQYDFALIEGVHSDMNDPQFQQNGVDFAFFMHVQYQKMLGQVEKMMETAHKVFGQDSIPNLLLRLSASSSLAQATTPATGGGKAENKKKSANAARQVLNASVTAAVAQSPTEPPPPPPPTVPASQTTTTVIPLDRVGDIELVQSIINSASLPQIAECLQQNLQRMFAQAVPEKEDAEKVTEVSAEEAVASASLAQQSFVEELRRSLAKVELFNGKLDKYMEFLNEIDEKIKKGKPAVERAVQLENRVKELEKANQAINLNLNKERQARECSDSARANAQLKAEEEEQKREQLNNLLKEKRAEIRRHEKRQKQDETRIAELTAQCADYDEKLKASRKEMDATKKRAAEDRTKTKKEKDRDTELIRRLEADLSEKEAEVQRVQHSLEEKVKESRSKSDQIAKDRKSHTNALTQLTERARRAECSQIDAELSAGIQVLDSASTDATTYINEIEENVKSSTDVEMLKKSVVEWKTLKEEIRQITETARTTAASNQELIRSGAKTYAQLPRFTVPRPPKPPARVSIPPPMLTPIGSSPMLASTSSPIVAPVAPMPAVLPLTPSTPQHGVIGQQRSQYAHASPNTTSSSTSPGYVGSRVSSPPVSHSQSVIPPESPVRHQPAPIGSSRPLNSSSATSTNNNVGVIGQGPSSNSERKTLDDIVETPSYSPWGWQNPIGSLGEGLQASAFGLGNSSSQSSVTSTFHQQGSTASTTNTQRPASVASSRFPTHSSGLTPYDHMSAELAQLNGATSAAPGGPTSGNWSMHSHHSNQNASSTVGQMPPSYGGHPTLPGQHDVFSQWSSGTTSGGWSLAPGQRPASSMNSSQMGSGYPGQGGAGPQAGAARSKQQPSGNAYYNYLQQAMPNS